ncbi:MAG: hypothetical protein QMB75_01755 [Thauera sp.]
MALPILDAPKTAGTFVTLNGTRYAITVGDARLADDGSIVIFGRGNNYIKSCA